MSAHASPQRKAFVFVLTVIAWTAVIYGIKLFLGMLPLPIQEAVYFIALGLALRYWFAPAFIPGGVLKL